jgi:LPS sulfotransferase NodH
VGWDVPPFAGDQSPRLPALYKADPVGFLEQRVFRRWPRRYRAVGFKLFYYHARSAPQSSVWEYLRDRRDIRVLHLKRRNRLAQFVSLTLAFKTDVWSVCSSTRPLGESGESLEVNAEECRRHFAWVTGMEADCASFFEAHRVLDIYYEDLTRDSNEEMAAVQEFLGLDPETLPARTVRQQTRPLSQVVTNYEELRTRFKATEWSNLFDLPAD